MLLVWGSLGLFQLQENSPKDEVEIQLTQRDIDLSYMSDK